MLAWNACPADHIQSSSCFNTTDWRVVVPFNTKMTISKRRASTVFSRSDFTIIDVIDLSDPTPVTYTPEEFFSFYEVIFRIAQNQTNWNFSTQFSFLVSVSSFLLSDSDDKIDSGGGNIQLRLQEFLACPIVIFNSAWLRQLQNSTADMGKSLSLATPSYRVLPFKVTILILSW